MQDPDAQLQPADIRGDGVQERLAQYDNAEAANRALLALDAGDVGSWSWDMAQGTVVGDRKMAALFGLDYNTQPWPEDQVFGTIHPDDLARVQGGVQTAIENDTIFQSEFREPFVDPITGATDHRWLSGRGNVTERDDAGNPTRMLGVNWDITAQKRREEQAALMAAEMDHRVKNAFAVIRALINLGARAEGSKKDFAEGLRRQVGAMATAHAVSAKMARDGDMPDAPVPVDALFQAALSPWIDNTVNPDCTVVLQSDASFMIHPRLVSSLSMMVYELATNAAKYGALGERGGTLTVTMTRGSGDTLRMDWDEVCTRPLPRTEPDTGFGSKLVGQCAAMLGEIIHQKTTDQGFSLALMINAPNS